MRWAERKCWKGLIEIARKFVLYFESTNQQTNNIWYKNYNKLFLFFTQPTSTHTQKYNTLPFSFVITFENCCLNNKMWIVKKIYRKTLIRILEQKYLNNINEQYFFLFYRIWIFTEAFTFHCILYLCDIFEGT